MMSQRHAEFSAIHTIDKMTEECERARGPACGLARLRAHETAARIYKFVRVDGKKCEGAEGAKILIKNQLKGDR
jgi:hypothetical protein